MAIFTESGTPVEPVNLDGSPMEDTASDIEEGAREQELTDPASEPETDEGTEEQEPAEPAEVEENEEAVPEESEQVKQPKTTQSKAENRKFAAQRRAKEVEDAQNAARDELIVSLKVLNPATGKPFANYNEYSEWKNAERTDKIRSQLEEKGVDPKLIDELIEQNPVVKAANEAVATAEAATEEAMKKSDNISFDKLLRDVGEIVPEIKTAEDLFSWEYYDEFRLLVSGGKDPAHVAELLSAGAKVKSSKQAAMNAIASKSHLTSTNTRRGGSSDYGITDEQYEMMRAINPNITRKQAAAAYTKYGH